MFICEIFANEIQLLPPTKYNSLKDISVALELTTSQVYDLYEGRTSKKYNSRFMPKINIKRFVNN